jgi:hypothetical protein
MNRITGMALVAVGLVVLNQSASAESNCKDARGKLVEFWDGGNDIPGRLSNGGWLNGATLSVTNSTGYPTPVSTAVSFTNAYTLTTRRGEVKGTRLLLYDAETGWGLDMTNIDPNSSTGIFAGATGVLYSYQIESNTDPAPTTYVSEVRALICFAHGRELPDR